MESDKIQILDTFKDENNRTLIFTRKSENKMAIPQIFFFEVVTYFSGRPEEVYFLDCDLHKLKKYEIEKYELENWIRNTRFEYLHYKVMQKYNFKKDEWYISKYNDFLVFFNLQLARNEINEHYFEFFNEKGNYIPISEKNIEKLELKPITKEEMKIILESRRKWWQFWKPKNKK